MKITPISNNYYSNFNYKKEVKTTNNKTISDSLYSNNNISFGWCVPHLTAAENLNIKFENSIKNLLSKQNSLRQSIENLNRIKQTRYSLLDDTAVQAAAMFSKYCNTQYTVAELLPTYALSLNRPLLDSIKELDIFKDPVKLLVTINNVTKLNMFAGIDKHTGKEYTAEETNKAKSGTQLYTVTLLMEQLKNKIDEMDNGENKAMFTRLYDNVSTSIDKIYGHNTINRILELSNIGPNPTYAQKVASLNLIKEFDKKGQALDLPENFEKELQELIDKENVRLEKTIENSGVGLTNNIGIKLVYHTHHHAHNSNHTPHGKMSDEEHRLFHLREQEQRLKQEQQRKS